RAQSRLRRASPVVRGRNVAQPPGARAGRRVACGRGGVEPHRRTRARARRAGGGRADGAARMSMKPARPRSHTLAVIAAALALSGAPSWAADSSAQIDDAARAAYSHPASGLAGLRALTEGGEGALRALAATAETEVLLALHELDALRQRIEQLRLDADLYVQAAADLAQARSLRAAGVLDGATRLAQSARARLMPAQGGAAADALRADACRLVGVLLGSSGEPEEGLRELDASRRLAKAAGDLRREALAMLDQSQIYTALRNPGAAR